MKYLMLLFCFVTQTSFCQQELLFSDLKGEELAQAIQQNYAPTKVLNYQHARDTMYAVIDLDQDSITCIYTGYRKYLAPNTDPSKFLFADGAPNDINCEHTWPRSKGTKEGNAFSDMHHLFPVIVSINQARGNQPFGDVHDHRTEQWYFLDEKTTELPSEKMIDLYSEKGDGRFEPREIVKGDIARAVFYVLYIYPEVVDNLFISSQMSTLLYWHQNDLPDEREIARTWKIAKYQEDKPNPFVVDTTLINRILESDE